MSITEFTARKLASADRAAQDRRLTDLDFRLLWVLLSAADRSTGVARRKQSELAAMLGCTRRAVQRSRDRLVSLGYLEPIGQKPGGYVSSYNVVMSGKATLYSPSEKGDPVVAKKATGDFKKATGDAQKGDPPFAHDPLISRFYPLRAREPSQRADALGPLGAKLRQQIDPANYESWFVKGEAVLIEQTAEAVTLAAKSKFVAEQIQNRFGDMIARASGTRGRVVVKVREETMVPAQIEAIEKFLVDMADVHRAYHNSEWRSLVKAANDDQLPEALRERATKLLEAEPLIIAGA